MKQVGPAQLELLDQALHSLLVGLENAVLKDVRDRHAELLQLARDENRTVAFEWLAFGTHDGDAVLPHSRQQTIKAMPKEVGRGQSRVAHPTVLVVTLWALTASTKLLAQKRVLDTGIFQSCLQSFPVELRVEAAIGSRTNVRERIDAVQLEKSDEPIDWMFGVPDCVDHTGVPEDVARMRSLGS